MGSSGAMAEVNPLRYRGYYFDQETGLYYLKSRYYDPFVCRFVNADVYVSTGQDILGANMFVYCNNNPTKMADDEGTFPVTLTIMAVGGAIGAAISGLSSAFTQLAFTGSVNWKSFAVDLATGFAGGALAASPVGLFGQVLGGGIINSVGYYADRRWNGQEVSAFGLGASFVSGMASGFVGGSGANKGDELTDLIEYGRKVSTRELRRGNQAYAAKVIERTTSYVFNKVSAAGIWAGFRYFLGGKVADFISGLFD